MTRTLKVLIGAAALAIIGVSTASAQTGPLLGRELYLFDGGAGTTQNTVRLIAPPADTITSSWTFMLPKTQGGLNFILVNTDGTGKTEWQDGNGIFWRLNGNTGTTPWNGLTGNYYGTGDATDLALRAGGSNMKFWFGAMTFPVMTLNQYGAVTLQTADGYNGLVIGGQPGGTTGPDAGIVLDCALPPAVGIEVNAKATGILMPTCALPPLVGISLKAQNTGIEIDDASTGLYITDAVTGINVTGSTRSINATGTVRLNTVALDASATQVLARNASNDVVYRNIAATGTIVTTPTGGTVNYLPLWSPSGTELGTSLVSQDFPATTVTTNGASVITGQSDLRGTVTNTTGTLTLSDNAMALTTTAGDLTVTVPGSGNDLILSGIATDNTTTSILTLTGSGEVRQTPLSDLFDATYGLDYNETTTDYEVRLGHLTQYTGNPITGTRYVNVPGNLQINTGVATGSFLTVDGTASQEIQVSRSNTAAALSTALRVSNSTNAGTANSTVWGQLNNAAGGLRTTIGISSNASNIAGLAYAAPTAGSGPYAIGVEGFTQISGSQLINYGGDFRSVSIQTTGTNAGVVGRASRSTTKNIGVLGMANASSANTNDATRDGLLLGTTYSPAGASIGLMGFNVTTGAGNYGLLVVGNANINPAGANGYTIDLGNTSGGAVTVTSGADITLAVPGAASGNDLVITGVDQNEATTKILTLDASNNVRWRSVPGTGTVVTGSGTQYYLPLWSNAAGTSLGNSMISQNAGATLATITGNASITGTVTLSTTNVVADATDIRVLTMDDGTGLVGYRTIPANGDIPTTNGPLTGNTALRTNSSGQIESVPLTDAQLLVGTASGPVAASLTSTGSTVSITSPGNNINLEVANPVPTPVGNLNYTLRSDGTAWVASSALQNNGTDVTATGGLAVNGSTTLGNDDADAHVIRGIVGINPVAGQAGGITIGNSGAGITNLNSSTINAPNLPSTGVNTDEFVVTDGTTLRTATVATMIGGTPWVVGGNTTAPANGIIGIATASTQDLQFYVNNAQAISIDDATLLTTINNDLTVAENTTLGNNAGDLTSIVGNLNVNSAFATAQAVNVNTAAAAHTFTLGNPVLGNTTALNSAAINVPNIPAAASATEIVVRDGSFNLGTRTIGAGTNIITGSGTNNTLTKWTSANTIGDGSITDNGTTVNFSTAAVQMPNLPNDPSASTWIVTYNNTTGALEKKDLGTPVAKVKSAKTPITGAPPTRTFSINDDFVTANSVITVTLQDGSDVNDYTVSLASITPTPGAGADFTIRLSGVIGAGNTKTVHYTITNP